MAINYSNVHLTIDQFQRVSNGTFNAGEVRLTSETEIEKVNNFIGRRWKNKTTGRRWRRRAAPRPRAARPRAGQGRGHEA